MMNKELIDYWSQLKDKDKRDIFNEVSAERNLPPAAIEKDWWVVRTLELVFDTSIAPHTVFKGGTSLSKAWGLIDRFSEDIDLALDRKHFGFAKVDAEMTGSQVKKLREKSFEFISENYYPELTNKFGEAGLSQAKLQLGEVKSGDQDPLIIEINYKAVTPHVPYLQPRVLIEVGSRSLIEPFEDRSFSSIVGEHFIGSPFADSAITVPTVSPERTFLEKIFLLHEEFQQASEKIRVERKSRHLYDLEKLMDTEFAKAALANKELYQTIVEHRRLITPLRSINYENHVPAAINPIPPDSVIAEWEKDYLIMRESLLYNPSLSFAELIERMKELKSRINQL